MGKTVKTSYRRQCVDCGQIFTSPMLFARHNKNLRNPEGFKCKDCCCSFMTVQNLAKHWKQKHANINDDDEEEVIPGNEESPGDTDNGGDDLVEPEGKACQDEGPTLRNQPNVTKMFACQLRKADGTECGYEGKCQSVLEAHKRIVHFKKYRCETCDWTWGKKSDLIVHKRSKIHRQRGKRGSNLNKRTA